jgi:GrpB-like predicted nucleotidyltransferase (UPF0157 family)
MRILPYFFAPAEFHVYDPKVAEVAGLLYDEIRKNAPELRVEHFGSTSVPGCGGKGIVDLAVLYPDGFLEQAKAILDGLGFQKQGGRDPWPESRPMRVGCVEHEGGSFRIHAHVVALGSDEHQEVVWFRDALRSSSELRNRYEERKRAILARGIDDPIDYCEAKGAFITEVLEKREPAANSAANSLSPSRPSTGREESPGPPDPTP